MEKYKNYVFSVGYMTMTSSQYRKLIDLLESYQPKNIIEFGCGQSTGIFECYCERTGKSLVSIEDNPSFKHKDTVLFPVVENNMLHIGDTLYDTCNYYDGLEDWLSQSDTKYDFILIDGPKGYGFRENYDYGRVQLRSLLLLDKISDTAIILVHDAQRLNMKKTISEFQHHCEIRGYKIWESEVLTDNMENQKLLKIFHIEKNNEAA